MTGHAGHALEARLARISVVLALVTLAALVLIDRQLHNDVSPQGIVSFEMCAYSSACRAIVEAWGPANRVWAALSLGLDYLFMLMYATAIFFGLRVAASGLPARLAGLTRLVAWSAWGAAVMDAFEDFWLARMLISPSAMSYAWPASIAATVKFTILGVTITWLVAAWVYRGVARWRAPAVGSGNGRCEDGLPPDAGPSDFPELAGKVRRRTKTDITGGLPVALRVNPRRTPWFAGSSEQPRKGCEEGRWGNQSLGCFLWRR